MKRHTAVRHVLRILSLSVTVLLTSNMARGQAPAGGPCDLRPRACEGLAQLATDPSLPEWQRDFARHLALIGNAATFDSMATGVRTVPSKRASVDSEGESWEERIVCGRMGHSAVFDPVRGRMLVFAGNDNPYTFRNDVWELSLAGTPVWTRVNATGTPPSERCRHSAIYDPLRDRMIVFGGSDGLRELDDVWALSLTDTPCWTRLVPGGTSPSARRNHTAIYDPLRDRMVVFGGWGTTSSYLDDVWALSLADVPCWTRLTPGGTSPSARHGHTAIYDSLRNRMVVFGGMAAATTYLNDVWTLSLADTSGWRRMTTSGWPSARYDHSAIYDPVRDRMLVFGGEYGAERNDVWALPLTGNPNWTELTPASSPGGRWRHSAVYDPAGHRMVVFGGWANDYTGRHLNDVWALSLEAAPVWAALRPGDTPPSARANHSSIYDPLRDRMVVFGGRDDVSAFNDVWTFSLTGTPCWTLLTTSGTAPGRRYAHSAIYDPVRDRMVVFGGQDASSRFNDVWTLSLAGVPTWAELTPAGPLPDWRCGHSAIYVPTRDGMVVFGGFWGFNDSWELSLADVPAWTPLTTAGTPPSARAFHGAVYDPVRDRMVVAGGWNGSSGFGDAWTLSLTGTPTWTELAPGGTEWPARAWHSAIYDPARDRMLVFGGMSGVPPYADRDDVWTLSLGGNAAWTEMMPTGTAPSSRSGHSAIYDPVRDQVAVFGGLINTTIASRNDLWMLRLAGVQTDVQVSLVSADATPDRVRLVWALGHGLGSSITVDRCTASAPWKVVGVVGADGTGSVHYEDTAITPGTRYGYRLAIQEGEREGFYGETWVDVPAAPCFALEGVRPNPSVDGKLWVSFALPIAGPATLDMFDVSGRQVQSQNVGSMGAGRHSLRLDLGATLPPGVYLLRLAQGARSQTTHAVVMR